MRVAALGLSVQVLSACTAIDPAVQQTTADWWSGAQHGGPSTAPKLSPGLDYLRVTISGVAVYLARGYTEADAAGPVTVWYSGQFEVLRLQRGRLAGLSGTPLEWRHVRGLASAPLLQSPLADASVVPDQHWVREVDQMPGYRWRLRDELVMQPISPPGNSALQGWSPQALVWAQEHDLQGRLPPSRYAWVPGQVDPVYGEQCLQVDVCLTWQRWPAPQSAGAASAATVSP